MESKRLEHLGMFPRELYDPSKDHWTNTDDLKYARTGHTASVLSNGKVLVVGGMDGTSIANSILNSVEFYDPSTSRWTTIDNLIYARWQHTASVLSDGKVLVTGGVNMAILNSAGLYNLLANIWTTTGNLNNARAGHTASVLSNGKVLVTGGYTNVSIDLNSAELY